MNKGKKQQGVSLVELLIYIVITGAIAGLMTGILINVLKIQTKESSSNEITSQLNFAAQTIQRLVRESSLIDIETGTTTSTLKLRMADVSRDPTYIYLENNAIKIKETDAGVPSELTTDRAVVNALDFKKFSQYPGHDTVQINITMTSASDSQISRSIKTGTIRVSAATFDDSILPGIDNIYNIGLSGTRWKDLNLSGILNLGTFSSDPPGQEGSIYYNDTDNVFRGYSSSTWSDLGHWNASGTDIYYNNGNVGIGTASPSAAFEVKNGDVIVRSSDSAPDDYIQIDARNWPSGSAIGFYEGGVQKANLYWWKLGPAFLINSVGTTDTIINSNGGNVGIGTTIPGAKLEVTGGETILEQEAWQVPTFQNGWLNYGGAYNPAGYFKDSLGVVHLRGLVKSGTIPACIFTLPTGYRPTYQELHVVQSSGAYDDRVDILTSGCVQVQVGNNIWVSLDGITFRAN